MKLKEKEHNLSIHYIQLMRNNSSVFREKDRHSSLFGPYCQFLSLFSTSVLFPIFLFLLMPLCVVTPRPTIRHRRCLVCSCSPGNPVCLLIPSTSASPPLTFFPRSLLSPPSAPGSTSWNKQPRDRAIIWTELK